MKLFITTLFLSLFSFIALGQAPQLISYQAEIRNNGNNLIINQQVGMRFSILLGSTTGTPVYVETHSPTTNANGLVSLQLGGGTVQSGNFASINWGNGAYYLKSETDPTGGSSYTITGTQQLLSVPYALYSNRSDNGLNNGTAANQMLYCYSGPPLCSVPSAHVLWKSNHLDHRWCLSRLCKHDQLCGCNEFRNTYGGSIGIRR
jgi:hypothetical protein